MRAHNFNAGPAGLPTEALEQARDELVDFQGSGMSIMEQSHRGKLYDQVQHEAASLITELLDVPSTHQVLFLGGGASLQFAMVPMNFLSPGASADYLVNGVWAEKALAEAQLVGQARAAVSTREPDGQYVRTPRPEELELDPNASYVHLTTNETIFGTQFHTLPDVGNVPLVADMSSDFMWRKFDVSRFALVYAGAQKNLGPSGVSIAIARKELLARARKDIPKILRYATHAESDSLYNTPPTFAVYLVKNVLEWTRKQGGLAAIEARNRKKAELLYGALDRHGGFYRAPVEKASRSVMNVVFRLPTAELDERFVEEARRARLMGLKGHRSTGGIRASLYNAVSVEDVQALVAFMDEFARKNG